MSSANLTEHNDIHTLYNNHHLWLRDWLGKKLRCSEIAADLAHDTFVRLLRRDKEGIVVQEPRAYLSSIARGLLINFWRRQDIERAYSEALALQPEQLQPSAEEQYLIMETVLQVDAMLRNLPLRVRKAFLMSRVEGLTYRQIGENLDVSERMVKKYMAQAMYHCLLLEESFS